MRSLENQVCPATQLQNTIHSSRTDDLHTGTVSSTELALHFASKDSTYFVSSLCNFFDSRGPFHWPLTSSSFSWSSLSVSHDLNRIHLSGSTEWPPVNQGISSFSSCWHYPRETPCLWLGASVQRRTQTLSGELPEYCITLRLRGLVWERITWVKSEK